MVWILFVQCRIPNSKQAKFCIKKSIIYYLKIPRSKSWCSLYLLRVARSTRAVVGHGKPLGNEIYVHATPWHVLVHLFLCRSTFVSLYCSWTVLLCNPRGKTVTLLLSFLSWRSSRRWLVGALMHYSEKCWFWVNRTGFLLRFLDRHIYLKYWGRSIYFLKVWSLVLLGFTW